LLVVSPWMMPICAQDLWRTVLFRDGRGGHATGNDALWALTMLMTGAVAIVVPSEWSVVGVWGAGATAGALLGLQQTRTIPAGIAASLTWWRQACWPLGRWLAADRLALNLGTQGVVFLVAGFLGGAELGGYRAAQSIFAPITLLGPAIALPGLPAITLAARRSWERGLRLSLAVSGVALVLTVAYLGAVVIVGLVSGQGPLALVFGPTFARFDNLLAPIGIAQLMFAGAIGCDLFLRALSKGRSLTLSHAVGSVALLVAVSIEGADGGIVGVAWGVAVGAGVGALGLGAAVIAARPKASDPVPAGIGSSARRPRGTHGSLRQ
jgi:O-antigen/teichoic acid export membrane protein